MDQAGERAEVGTGLNDLVKRDWLFFDHHVGL